MPDIFVVNRVGAVVEYRRDRARCFERIYAIGGFPMALVYRGDPHDVIAPRRIEPVKRAAERRKRAWFDSFRACINCGLHEDEHGGWLDDWGWEPKNEDACADYTRPSPLVAV